MTSTTQLKRVLIMAGGTGGHVFPGLAIANYLQQHGVDVHWLGTKQGMESRLVPEVNIPLHFITINGVRGKGIKTLMLAPFKIFLAIQQSMRVIKKIHPDITIGMGGFVSGPGGIASWLTRCPLIIHEQNAKVGLTNRALACFSKRILEGFPTAFTPRSKVMTIGNPVRHELEHLPPPQERLIPNHAPFRLLILGGSLGAKALNEVVPRAIAKLKHEERPEIWHQTGEKHYAAAKKAYESMGVQANLTPFIKNMAHAYAWTNMVLCRAGALTVTELCAVGVGAIFVPFPFAVDDHQTANADFMVKHKAALCIQQSELTEDRLADVVKQFSQSPESRFDMAKAAYQLRRVNVAERFYKILCEVIH
ncbi:MAG: undecaprenyldiphospho-muramoylpentapeptide beta-N-acetylglucosaminyltransferase [Gammaproteobacteria bacterium]|nr:undecaprenyldiphospho-muramoylpentapeptide beta-N-acetylglucosaminyltransferase [Gammaproteobacteria bacterium]MCW5582700.1 undecaprenyldiphospho-muramoylpentapeptide beta-N-acetylglucosaminyltransferase [Gammaproteobacteria bacterium]